MKSVSPIIGVILHRLGGEFERNYATNGRFSPQKESEYDLFFADEEDELTEFEKELEKFRAHILTTSGEKYDKMVNV